MRFLLRIFYESASQAVGQLRANKLRTFLSLLGILIGILSIIGVKAAIDSLEANIQESFEKLGKDMIYVDQFPWNEDPNQNFWKYYQRPKPDFDDYEAITRKVSSAQSASIAVIIPGSTLKYKSSSIRGGAIAGVSYDYFDMYEMELDAGRYFTFFEYESAADKIILGYELAVGLFKNADPLGKYITVRGRKMQVIGVIKKEGNSLINVFNYDEAAMISYNTAKKIVNVKTGKTWGNSLNVKAKPGVELDNLIEEVRGVLRVERNLKPIEDDDFSINTLSTITNVIQPIFSMMNMVGFVIGLFAMLVGAFSVANIMFVSVKERTNIIGIKKALGARKNTILLEFLIESVILCIIGGIAGLALIIGVLKILTSTLNFEMFLSLNNILLGLFISTIVGIISGIIPAIQAARMDPVVAIRK